MKKNKSFSDNHGRTKFSYDYKKNAKHKYFDAKKYFKKESQTNERSLKFEKSNIGFQNNYANPFKTNEDDSIFVVALFTLVSTSIWCPKLDASQHHGM